MEINPNKAMVELVRENPNDIGCIYASVELPISKLQTQDALHRARWTTEDDGEYRELYFTNCPKLPGLVNMVINDATLREADFFAKRLEQLPLEELIALNAIVENNLDAGKYKDGVSMKELINQTYGLDVVMIASDVGNDEALGQFVIENELHEDVTSVPENAIYLLDKEKYLGIGQTKAREILTKTENNFTVRIGNRLYVNKRQLDKWLMNISGNHVDKVRGNRRWERTIKEKNLEHISIREKTEDMKQGQQLMG